MPALPVSSLPNVTGLGSPWRTKAKCAPTSALWERAAKLVGTHHAKRACARATVLLDCRLLDYRLSALWIALLVTPGTVPTDGGDFAFRTVLRFSAHVNKRGAGAHHRAGQAARSFRLPLPLLPRHRIVDIMGEKPVLPGDRFSAMAAGVGDIGAGQDRVGDGVGSLSQLRLAGSEQCVYIHG
jgi:hypothetical protein